MENVLTTGEVAKKLCVSRRTVAKWIDSGLLRGFKIPNGRTRKVALFDFLKFCKVHQIPMSFVERENAQNDSSLLR